jgi:membrane fusion protein (multidrug efflux system)
LKPSVRTTSKNPFLLNRQGLIRLFAGIVILAGITVGTLYLLHALAWQGTDDAFVTADVVQLNSKVSNQVKEVLIYDNEIVKKGDLLVRIDDRDYRVQLEQAQANYDKAKSDFDRYSALISIGAISKADFDASKASLETTQAQLDQARLNLNYTEIRAPVSGKITSKNIEPGDYLQAGQTFCSIVPQSFWVLANYKETQLTHMRVGQKAVLWVDSLPGHKFVGHVDSLQSGTGAAFSLFPPENATGNYVKVVQRLPVKIVFDGPDDELALLAPGMSVMPEVRVK